MAGPVIIMFGIRRCAEAVGGFFGSGNDILENRAGVLESIAATLGPYIATEPPP
jgi:hypothetical protein